MNLRCRVVAFCGLLVLLPPGLLRADVPYFHQNVGTDWFEPLNWDTGTIPTTESTAFIQSGTATISSPGAVADYLGVSDTLVIDGHTAGLTVNGTLNVASFGDSAADPDYGYLIIRNGAMVNSGAGEIAYGSNAIGSAVVSGTGSSWTILNSLHIAARAAEDINNQGELTVSDGGLVSVNSTLRLGYGGRGSLTVSNSGTVVSGRAQIATGAFGSSGDATITGPGSQWSIGGNLSVGTSGSGTLTVQNGGLVNASGTATIGDGSSGGGYVLVDGAGSQLSTGNVEVGRLTTGSLAIQNGGKVFTYGSATLSSGDGGRGTGFVDGAGSSWTISDALGFGASGTVTVRNGAALFSATNTGVNSSSIQHNGALVITDAGSVFSNTNALVVGNVGGGSLSILNGATGTTGSLYAGFNTSGTISVDGAGSRLTILADGQVYVGRSTNGYLTVSNGGVVNTPSTIIGFQSALDSTLTVTGSGSRLISGQISVGGNTNGNLVVSNGGVVTSTGAGIVINPVAGTISGSATVTGAGSQWNLSEGLDVGVYVNAGMFNLGTLVAADGGAVNVGGNLSISQGSRVKIGNGGQAGTISAATIFFGGQSAAAYLEFDNTGTAAFTGVILGAGQVIKSGSGTATLSGDNSYTMGTVINGGLLRATANATALGTTNTGTVTLNGGNLSLVNNTGLNFGRRTLVSSSGTIFSDRTSNGAGVTHTLGTLSIGARTLAVAPGSFVTSGVAGLTFGTTTLTANGAAFSPGAGSLLTLGAIGGNFGFAKQGAGQLTLGTASTRSTASGSTTLSEGILRLTNASALNTGAAALALNGGNLQLANNTSTTFNGSTVTLGGDAALTLDRTSAGAAVTHMIGALSLGSNALTIGQGSNFSANVAGSLITGAVTLTGNPTLVLDNVNGSGIGSVTLGTLGDNGAARVLRKTGSGNLFFGSAAGSLTSGGSVIVNRGTARVNTANALGSSALMHIVVNGTTAGGTSSFALNNVNQSVLSLTFGGSGATSTSTNIVSAGSGTLTLGGGVTYDATGNPLGATLSGNVALGSGVRTFAISDSSNAATDLAVSAVISGVGGLTKTGAGVLSLSGANTYTGTTTVTSGTLSLGAANVLSNAGAVRVEGGVLNVASFNDTVGAVTLAGGSIVGTTGTLTGSSYAVQSGTIAARLGGTGALTKTTSGLVLLSGANTYSGSTTVSSGTLVAGNNAAVGTGAVSVSSDGTFLVEAGVTVSNTVRLSGGTYARGLADGANLANSLNTSSNLGGADTAVAILAGTTSSAATIFGSFSVSTGDTLSDVFHLSGVPVVSGSTTDIFVLQLSMTSVEPGSFLGWLNGSDEWVNAALGNTGNNASGAQRGYNGTFAAFQLAYGNTLSNYVGAWGFTGTSVWTVLNHNSEFGVVPEPSIGLLVLGGVALMLGRRNRRTA